MKRLLGAGIVVSLTAPVVFLLLASGSFEVLKSLGIPLIIVTAALLNLLLSLARRVRFCSYLTFVPLSVVGGVACMWTIGYLVSVAVFYFPVHEYGLPVYEFQVMPFVHAALLPAALYSFVVGSVFWLLGMLKNPILIPPTPSFVAARHEIDRLYSFPVDREQRKVANL